MALYKATRLRLREERSSRLSEPEPRDLVNGSEPLLTRRTVLHGLALASGGLALVGCGGGSLLGNGASGGGELTLRKRSIAVNPETFVLANEDGVPVHFLASFTDNGIQAAYWGTQTAEGRAERVRQALVWDRDATIGFRTRYDDRGAPVQVVDAKNGAFVTAHWEEAVAVFKFYQGDGAYIGGARVSGGPPAFVVEQLPDSAVVGYFTGTLQDATAGIFAFTVGGIESPPQPMIERGARREDATSRTAGEPNAGRLAVTSETYRRLLNGLKSATTDADLSAQARAILSQLATEFGANGKSSLFARIVAVALKDTALTALFPEEGRATLRALVALPLLSGVATDLTKTDPTELVKTGALTSALSSPGFTGYLDSGGLPGVDPKRDRTHVAGIAVAREFDTVALTGYVDAGNRVFASGTTKDGTEIELVGTVADGKVTGRWTSAATARGGGLFDGILQALGICQEQQQSGGQGTYTNSYDLQKCGDFPFAYDAYTIPDHFIVLNGGRTVFDTGGLVSGSANPTLHVSGASTIVTVVVLASESGTAWRYTVGCPS